MGDKIILYGRELELLIRTKKLNAIDIPYHKKCIKEGTDYVNEDGNTPFMYACFLGYKNYVVQLSLFAKPNIKKINYSGQNALTLASHSGNIDIVRLLLDEEWTYKDFTETSLVPPLCVAAMRGHLELVKFYAKLIPGPSDIVTPHGVNALMLAVANRQYFVGKYLMSLQSDETYSLLMAKNGAGYSACNLIEKFEKKAQNKGR